MTDAPFLELIICTYNNAEMLAGALTAIAQQQVTASVQWGVLVVNNNCTDHTAEVVEQAIGLGNIPNLRMVSEAVQGLTPARLCGVHQTMAPWIAFVDDDCFLAPNWVAEAAQFALQQPHCGAFGGRVTLEWEVSPPAYAMPFKYAFAEQELGTETKPVSWLVGAGVVINRSALAAVGWIERQLLADRVGKTLVSGGDMEIALRIAAQYQLWYVPTMQLFHQIAAQRMTYQYLLNINYRLGMSQLFVKSLEWDQSYPAWVLRSIQEAWKQSFYASKVLIKSVLQRCAIAESRITLQFWWGYWVGIWQLFSMDTQQRQQLLGSAKAYVK